jgi:hypothetical protein
MGGWGLEQMGRQLGLRSEGKELSALDESEMALARRHVAVEALAAMEIELVANETMIQPHLRLESPINISRARAGETGGRGEWAAT